MLCLSHLAFKGTRVCPANSRVGRTLTPLQLAAVSRIQCLVEPMFRPYDLCGGRARKTQLLGEHFSEVASLHVGMSIKPLLPSHSLRDLTLAGPFSVSCLPSLTPGLSSGFSMPLAM
jgi:hypothetical protein